MKRLQSSLLFILCLLSPLAALADGTISGRVTDGATKLPLGGVRVTVAGSPLETYTSSDGRYVLINVPAGEQTLTFNYVGYPATAKTVDVAAAGTTDGSVAFGGDIVEMDRFVIEGSVVGTARAINEQRAANTLKNIVASDEIGRFPDQNAAEALQRVPGVSLYRDQGEGRYIVLRGLNFNYTSVKVNGGSFAGADLGERATALDVIPADALAAIEVTKVPTPDMDGEGLGGQVNIKTKSPFDSDGFDASVTIQGQYADQSDKFSSKVNGFVSNRFGSDNQFGFLIAPTWQSRKFSSYNFETGGAWSEEQSPSDGNDYYVIEELEFREYIIERERYGVNLAFEAQPDTDTQFALRAGYNKFTDTEDRQLTIFDFTEGTLTAADANSATYSSLRRFGRRLRSREKDQEVSTITASLEKRIGNWSFDASAGYTKGTEKRPDEITTRFRRNTRDSVVTYTTDGPYSIAVNQTAGGSYLLPSSYNFQRVDLANETGDETEYDFGVNGRYDFAGERPTYVKFGALIRSKEKTSEAEIFEFDSAPGDFTFANYTGAVSDYPYLKVPQINSAAVRNAYFGNRNAFTGERIFADSEFDDWTINEDVNAIYVMAGSTFGRLNVIGGVRVEQTKFSTTGRDVDLDNETATNVSASRDYTNTLPGVYLRFDASEKIVWRASWSNSIARPGFGDIALRRNISEDDGEIFIGNPNLDTLEAVNWDASVEYYLPSLGVISAAVFHKQIDNFAYEYTSPTPQVINNVAYEVTSFANGSDGSISGLELAYQQQLGFLPAPFDGLGLLANVTFLDSEATYPTRPNEDVPFIGQSDYVGNLGFTYEKAGFFARLAMNFRSERLREDEPIGGDASEDLWVDDFAQLDLTLRYKLTRQFEVYAELLNLTDEPFRVFLKSDNGQTARLGQVEEYGWSANFGVRWKL
ncbi:MAG: TonB-dependent receptor [Opitutaceae bacterium]